MSEAYEQSADMRLLNWQRESLGLQAPPASTWRTDNALEAAGALIADAPPDREGAVLTFTASGSPQKGLIPGAIVTLSLAIQNAGAEPARSVRVMAPLPGATNFRPGSLQIDQLPRPDDEIEKLTGVGLELGDIAPGRRVGITFKASVLPGADPLVFAPTVLGRGGAVVAGRPVLLTRGAAPSAFTRAVENKLPPTPAPPDETPFYELDDEEALVYEAAESALSVPAVRAHEETRPQEPAPPSPAEPLVAAEPPAPAPVILGEGVLLAGTLRPPTLTLLRRLLSGKGLGLLPHFVIANALACSQVTGSSDTSLAQYFDAENARLQRALVQRRLGRQVQAEEYAADIPEVGMARVRAGTVTSADVPRAARAITVFTVLAPADVEFLKRLAGAADAGAFIRARQLAIALMPHDAAAANVGDERVAAALRAYSAILKARINALFVKLKIAPKTSALGEPDPDADAAAQAVLDALEALPLE